MPRTRTRTYGRRRASRRIYGGGLKYTRRAPIARRRIRRYY